MNLCGVCGGWTRLQWFSTYAEKHGRPKGFYHFRCITDEKPNLSADPITDDTDRHIHRSDLAIITRSSRVVMDAW